MAMTTDGIFYVEDVARDQLGPGGVDSLIEQTAGADGVKCSIREEQEPGSAGKSVIVARTKSLAGYDYSGVPATGDKVTRARPFRAQCEAGNVRLVRGPWNEDYLRELSVFPAGSHDDQVDGSSCAFNELALQRVPDTRTTWGSGSR
jgi:predicted phage terminase large subunit-like protein